MKNACVYSSGSKIIELKYSYLCCHLWRKEYPAYCECEVALFALSGKGIFVNFRVDESSPRAVFVNRDDPVCNDSCVEFFFQPFADDERYLNFEINPNGAYLCAVGCDRYDRVLLSKISTCEPKVSTRISDSGWKVVLFVPESLVSDAFSRKFSVAETEYIRANFYKCGDQTPSPHYFSLFPVETASPDFHRPEYFRKIYFQNERDFKNDKESF